MQNTHFLQEVFSPAETCNLYVDYIFFLDYSFCFLWTWQLICFLTFLLSFLEILFSSLHFLIPCFLDPMPF